MKNNLHPLRRIAVVVTVLALSSTIASATIWNMAGSLDGLQETPANASPGIGVGTLTLDDVTGQVTVTSGSFSGLTAAANNMHIHGFSGPGVASGVLFGLTFTPATSGTFSGGGTLTAPQVTQMLAGQTYFNIHSGSFPGGEIRGQITVVPEPSIVALAGLGAGALLWQIRRKRS